MLFNSNKISKSKKFTPDIKQANKCLLLATFSKRDSDKYIAKWKQKQNTSNGRKFYSLLEEK